MIVLGDCIDVLKGIEYNSVNLAITSPPYANQRKDTYGGVSPEHYVEWFLERSEQVMQVLAEDGSFVLNIKHHAKDGRKEMYVYQLITALGKQGWKLIDDLIWHKKNGFPSSRPNALLDSWEFCFHLAKNTDIKIRKENVRVPAKESTKNRCKNMRPEDYERNAPGTGSGMTRRVSSWVGRDYVYPPNVLHVSAETTNQGHPAVFPVRIPDFFIRLLTDPGDMVLDPFVGSGTTCVAAHRLGRKSIGIERDNLYHEVATRRLQEETKQGRLEV